MNDPTKRFELELVDRLKACGVESADALHTGGGVFVCAIDLDPTGRRGSPVADVDGSGQHPEMWITHDGDALLVGLYDSLEHDEGLETCMTEIRLRDDTDAVQRAVEYVTTYARITGLILP